jgi:hypothetical protein
MDAVLFMEIRFYGHLRLRQASLSMRTSDSMRTEIPNRIRCLYAQYNIFIYKFSAAFRVASLQVECHKPRLFTG